MRSQGIGEECVGLSVASQTQSQKAIAPRRRQMRNRFLFFRSIGVCIALASCTDAIGPPTTAPPSGGAAPSVESEVTRSDVNIRVMADASGYAIAW